MTQAVPPAQTDEPRLAAWEKRLDWPLTGLAIAFLAGYAWLVLDTDLTQRQRWWFDAVLWVVWAVFAADYLVRLWLARRKWRFVRRHVLDLVMIVLPMFRQLRALRLINVLMTLHRQASNDFRGKVSVYVVGATMLVGFTAALAVYDAERDHPDASITTFGDALWWTITTISTVGYGDRYPVTAEGRVVAGALMLSGVALLGTVTATIASLFVERVREDVTEAVDDAVDDAVDAFEVAAENVDEAAESIEDTGRELSREAEAIMAELRRLNARLDALQTSAGPARE